MLTQEKNRQAAGGLVPAVAASLVRHITMLESELADLDDQISRHVTTHPRLREQRDLLVTIPGIGATTAARLLAECRAITDFATARAYAAFAGLVPRERQSGPRRGRARLSKLGSSRLRLALLSGGDGDPAQSAARGLRRAARRRRQTQDGGGRRRDAQTAAHRLWRAQASARV